MVPPASKCSACVTDFSLQINALKKFHQIRAVNRFREY
jgi:hypothetical protein